MSELSITPLPPPLPGVPPGAGPPAAPGLPTAGGRGDAADTARIVGAATENPFAALLAGFFSAAQATSPAADAPVGDPLAADALALPAASGHGAALPGLTIPPAPTATATGNALPPDGQGLPLPAIALTGAAPLPAGEPPGRPLAPVAGIPADGTADALPVAGEPRAALPRPAASAPDVLPGLAASPPRPEASVLAEIRFSLASRQAGDAPAPEAEADDLPSLGELLGTAPATTTDGAPAAGRAVASERPLPLIPGTAMMAGPPVVALPPALVNGGATVTAPTGNDASLLPAPNGGNTGATPFSTGGNLGTGAAALPPLPAFGDTTPWASHLGDRLLAFSGQGTHSARMKLYPEYLGELDVRLQLEDGQARVWFHTSQAQARDVLEASLPRLRELFQQGGLELVNAQVDYGQGGQPGGGREQSLPQPAWLADVPGGSPHRPAAMTGLPALLAARGPDPARRLDVLA